MPPTVTITVVEDQSTYPVIISIHDPTDPTQNPYLEGIVDHPTTLSAALELAYSILHEASTAPTPPGYRPHLQHTFTTYNSNTPTYRTLILTRRQERAAALARLQATPSLPPAVRTILQYYQPKPKPAKAPLPTQHVSGQIRVHLSDRAWLNLQQATTTYGYEGRSRYTGVSQYLKALLAANPDPKLHYTDNRPDYIRNDDIPRLKRGLFPRWDPYYNDPDAKRIQRLLNLDIYEVHLEPILLKIANRFIIAPPRGEQLASRPRAVATLEAIAYGYLTTHNPPNMNPHPINATLQKYYRNRKRKLDSRVEITY